MADTEPIGATQWQRRSEKVAGVVARQIVRHIADEQLPPGTVLESEGAMLRRYAVSRASLREALRILEIQGLVRIKPGPGGGPSVCEVDSADFGRMATMYFQVLGVRFWDLVEARLSIEPFMAALAARRHEPAEVEELRDIIAWGNRTESDSEWLTASHAFHAKVLDMSGNQLLSLVACAFKDIYTDRVSTLNFKNHGPVREAHERIADAISAGDEQVAYQLMREHMEEYAQKTAEGNPSLMDEVVDWR